jgi:Xaa-Pro aminopeptidase
MIADRVFRGGHHAAELEAPEAYRERRRRLQARLEDGAVVVLLGAGDARGYGDVGTFRQDPDFFYLTGAELPNAALILQKDHEMLLLPERRPNVEVWTGPRYGPGAESAEVYGFEAVHCMDATEIVVEARRRPVPGFENRLAGLLGSGGPLWIRLPGGVIGEMTREQRLVAQLRRRLPTFAVRDLSDPLAELRLRKSPGEVALLRKAVAATIAGVRAAAAEVRPGAREGELDGTALAACRAAGAEGWACPPIVGSGPAGCILHYDANAGVLAEGELVVVDIGARYGYYCGDLTRTFPVSGRFSARQRELYLAVLAAYDAAVATLKPGAKIADARHAAYRSLAECGVVGEDGLAPSEFFLHGLGHHVGLETHDVGGESPSLAPGMVLTVEPGVYLPREGIGIRVEDDYLITESGAECLSAALPRDLDSIEAMVGDASRPGTRLGDQQKEGE